MEINGRIIKELTDCFNRVLVLIGEIKSLLEQSEQEKVLEKIALLQDLVRNNAQKRVLL
ncbi:MAG: hypothetical protein V1651_02125 [Patescibacteria group bacterium]